MMIHWTLRRKVASGYAMVLAFTLAVGLIGVAASRSLSNDIAEANDALAPTISEADEISHLVASLQQTMDAVVAAAERSDVHDLATQSNIAAERRDELAGGFDAIELLTRSPEMKSVSANMREALREWDRRWKAAQDLAAARQPSAAAFVSARETNNRLYELASQATRQARRDLAQQAVAAQQRYATQRLLLILLIVASALVAGWRLRAVHKMTDMLKKMSMRGIEEGNELATAAAQVSMSAQSLAQTASEQAASLEETSATMEELAAMTRQNADRAQRVATLMHKTDQDVADSNASMGAAIQSMIAIDQSSQRVSRILKTIDEITFQTNILALNAAVEAARAGEAGLGFAAVAEEVRNLAQRSASAARDTAVLVEESMANSRDGRGKVEQLGAALDSITAQVREAREFLDEVTTGSLQQAQGIAQITEAITQMEQITQLMATTSEQNAAASEEMSAYSTSAIKVASALQRFVDGKETDATSVPHAGAAALAQHAQPSTPIKVVKMGHSAKPTLPLEASLADTGTFRRF